MEMTTSIAKMFCKTMFLCARLLSYSIHRQDSKIKEVEDQIDRSLLNMEIK